MKQVKRFFLPAVVVVGLLAPGARSQELTEADITELIETFGPFAGVNSADDIEVVIEDGTDSGNLAEIEKKEGGGCKLTVYPDQFDDTYEDETGGEGLSGSTGEGLVTPEIIHEMMHKCKEDSGDTDGCSCNHFLIDYSVASIICSELIGGLGGVDEQLQDPELEPGSQEEMDLKDKKAALCASLQRLKDKWCEETELVDKKYTAGDCWRCEQEEYGDAVGAGCGLSMPPAPPNGDDDCSDASDPSYETSPIPCCESCDDEQ